MNRPAIAVKQQKKPRSQGAAERCRFHDCHGMPVSRMRSGVNAVFLKMGGRRCDARWTGDFVWIQISALLALE
jgi:hypothetical protein